MLSKKVERAIKDKVLVGDRSQYINEDNTTKDEFIAQQLNIIENTCISRYNLLMEVTNKKTKSKLRKGLVDVERLLDETV